MAISFVAFLPPSRLDGYRPELPFDQQPLSIPATFIDAMEVRHSVFVLEQQIPLQNEFDTDDPRSCHWVAYASVDTERSESRGPNGTVERSRSSDTPCFPVGTVRIVPFPHSPHPEPGGRYIGGVLVSTGSGQFSDATFPSKAISQLADILIGPSTGAHRATSLHDGKEPYIKLGRLAVVNEFRHQRIAGLVIRSAISWLRENSTYFDPSVTQRATSSSVISGWKGLLCVHAQQSVIGHWKTFGFEVDERMGEWAEEGIPHVGMFTRLQL